jgi:hypothetical protein
VPSSPAKFAALKLTYCYWMPSPMPSPGPNSKLPASTSMPVANGGNAVSPKPSPSRLPVPPCNLHQRRPTVAAQACDLAGRHREVFVKQSVRGGLRAPSAKLPSENVLPAGFEMSEQNVAADWRYLGALRALAVIRKLGDLAVQIHVGEQQVKLSGSAAGQQFASRSGGRSLSPPAVARRRDLR